MILPSTPLREFDTGTGDKDKVSGDKDASNIDSGSRPPFIVSALAEYAFAVPAGQVTICHSPPGNPENAHTITISENALSTHLDNHGNLEANDYYGECVEDDKDKDSGDKDSGDKDSGDKDSGDKDKDSGPSGKVTLCHVPPGNPGNAHTLRVSENALNGHLDNNGSLHNDDYLGECEEEGPGALFGGVLAYQIFVYGTYNFHYDEQLKTKGDTTYTLSGWHELINASDKIDFQSIIDLINQYAGGEYPGPDGEYPGPDGEYYPPDEPANTGP